MRSFDFLLRVAAAVACAAPVYGQSPAFTPLHENGVYDAGERVSWTAHGGAGVYSYTVRKNNREVIRTGTIDLGRGAATIEAQVDEPAMLYVDVTPEGAGKATIHLGAAVAPWGLRPSTARPADFDTFWDGKLKALAEIPINPVLTPRETAQSGVELYTVKLDSVGSNVQGYLARPAREGKFPALIVYQYAGVYALRPQTATDRAAEGWLAFDVDSHDLAPDQATGVSPQYAAIGNTDRERSYFLNMYLRDARAVDYIRSRPDWDGKTIVLMGTSMGGQQSLVTAGLRPDVTAVIVNEPSGCDTNGDLHGRKAGYPNWPSGNPKAMETALYFDPVNFARRIGAPVLAGIGFIDTTSPPAGIWTALNESRGAKEVVGMVESDHNNRTPEKQGAFVARSREALEALRRGEGFRPDEGLTRNRAAILEGEGGLRKRILATFFVPSPLPDPAAEAHGSFEPAPGVVAERVSYRTEFGMEVPAIVYRAKEARGRRPALIVVNGHGGDKTSWYAFYAGILYARAGAVVLTYDPAGEGERNSQRKTGTRQHDIVRQPEIAMGRRMAGLMITDIEQAVSYLAGRPDVDPQRIGAMGYSMGSFVTALACAVETRLSACVLTGGGNLDGPEGYWDTSVKKMCQSIPYRSLTFLGDRGAVLYAMQASHAATFVYNGWNDEVTAITADRTEFFDDLRRRAAALAGGEAKVFTFGFDPQGSHRPYFVTLPVAEWLAKRMRFPDWAAVTGETHISEWARENGVSIDRAYATEPREGGTMAAGRGIPGVAREKLMVFGEEEWRARSERLVLETWWARASGGSAERQ